MKKFAFIIASLAALAAGFTAKASSDEDNKEVIDRIAKRDLTVVVDMIMPMVGPARQSLDGYTLTIHDGKVDADLPFIGESHAAIVPGVDEVGIRFDNCPIEIKEDKSKVSKGFYEWRFSARSGSEDVDVYMTIWTTGEAEIRCQPVNRSAISYRGSVKLSSE